MLTLSMLLQPVWDLARYVFAGWLIFMAAYCVWNGWSFQTKGVRIQGNSLREKIVRLSEILRLASFLNDQGVQVGRSRKSKKMKTEDESSRR